ncbi:MAG TPA: cytochrome c [Crenotrichaceae bacterium]|nr:cytochrome c [Crenotrichaceae bacterium]
MTIKIFKFMIYCGLILIATSRLAFAAGNPEAGKVKFVMCAGCHAIPGYSNAFPRFQVPKLGGQQADFLLSALKSYAKGERNHASMNGTAMSLSDQDMLDITAFLSDLAFSENIDRNEVFGDPVAGKKKAKNCATCHGNKGKSSSPGFPNLIGQYETYLIHSLTQYKMGKRKNPMMTGMTAALSEEDIKNIAAFYASQKKGLSVPIE